MDNYNDAELSLKKYKEKTDEAEGLVKEKESSLSNKNAFMVIVYLLAMFVAISTIPTCILFFVFDIGFWMSQLYVLIGIIIIVPLFGLHKPASDEQKLKRKSNL